MQLVANHWNTDDYCFHIYDEYAVLYPVPPHKGFRVFIYYAAALKQHSSEAKLLVSFNLKPEMVLDKERIESLFVLQ